MLMAAKTITITEKAHNALQSLKKPNESFSETILRVAGRKPLSEFFGVLSKKSGERLEKTVLELRKKHNEVHRRRMRSIISELRAENGVP